MATFYSRIVQLSLVALTVYFGYECYRQEQSNRLCLREIKDLEADFEAEYRELINADSRKCVVQAVQTDYDSASWFVHLPAGESLMLVLESSAPNSSRITLLRIPARHTLQRGVIHLRFVASPNGIGYERLEVLALDQPVSAFVPPSGISAASLETSDAFDEVRYRQGVLLGAGALALQAEAASRRDKKPADGLTVLCTFTDSPGATLYRLKLKADGVDE